MIREIYSPTGFFEEAVFLADRAIVLGSNLGCLRGELAIYPVYMSTPIQEH